VALTGVVPPVPYRSPATEPEGLQPLPKNCVSPPSDPGDQPLCRRPRLDREKYRRQWIAIDIRETRVDLLLILQRRRVDHMQLIVTGGPGEKHRVVRREDPRHRRDRLAGERDAAERARGTRRGRGLVGRQQRTPGRRRSGVAPIGDEGLNRVGGRNYLVDVDDAVVSQRNLIDHGRRVKRNARGLRVCIGRAG